MTTFNPAQREETRNEMSSWIKLATLWYATGKTQH